MLKAGGVALGAYGIYKGAQEGYHDVTTAESVGDWWHHMVYPQDPLAKDQRRMAEERRRKAEEKQLANQMKGLAGEPTAGIAGEPAGAAQPATLEQPDLWRMWMRGEIAPDEYSELTLRQDAGDLTPEKLEDFFRQKREAPAAAVGQLPNLSEAIAAPRSIAGFPAGREAGITELGAGAFAFPAAPEPAYAQALRRQKTPAQRTLTVNAEGVDVSESYTDRGREVLIRVLIPETAPGILTDATDAYLEDFAYQGVG